MKNVLFFPPLSACLKIIGFVVIGFVFICGRSMILWDFKMKITDTLSFCFVWSWTVGWSLSDVFKVKWNTLQKRFHPGTSSLASSPWSPFKVSEGFGFAGHVTECGRILSTMSSDVFSVGFWSSPKVLQTWFELFPDGVTHRECPIRWHGCFRVRPSVYLRVFFGQSSCLYCVHCSLLL